MKEKSNFGKFLILWIGELISSIGGGLTSFGLGVYIFRQTGSAASMAVVTLLGFLPTLLLSVPAGVLADRYDRRLLMMIGDGCSALGILYILICMMRGETSLVQICIGVFISAVFSALLEPSFRATITDILTKEEYSKASGLVSLAGSARYLFSPIIAGFLLTISDVKLLLVIDICTFFLTVAGAAIVRKGIGAKVVEAKGSFAENLILICTSGFLFFAALPFANNCLDYLARTNIPDELQGRAWGLIGFLSQLGYVAAYAVSGVAADMLGSITGRGVGRGSAMVIQIAGICQAVIALSIMFIKSIKELETSSPA